MNYKFIKIIMYYFYINDGITLTYDSSKIAELVCLNENERNDYVFDHLRKT